MSSVTTLSFPATSTFTSTPSLPTQLSKALVATTELPCDMVDIEEDIKIFNELFGSVDGPGYFVIDKTSAIPNAANSLGTASLPDSNDEASTLRSRKRKR
ncbi:hypothetical protein NX059_004571 [Plenodomus lindquistii]|nr:hypothetical protein NX059_004571 [Plenodomus lindquistii]